MTDKYGPLVRLWGFDKSQLPEEGATGEDLKPLLTSLLLEALPFIAGVPAGQTASPGSDWKPRGIKTYPHSTAPVDIYERVVAAQDLQDVAGSNDRRLPQLGGQGAGAGVGKVPAEHWFMRRSTHEDEAADGTASWAEWVRSFKDEHAEAEKRFTPTVVGTEVLREWDCAGVEVEVDAGVEAQPDGQQSSSSSSWSDWTLKLEQSTHKMPAPLKPRLFPVLQATASRAGGRREFLVVQVAYRDLDLEARGAKEHVRASYTSVERLREVDGGRSVEWVMATASDAKGLLPAWVQRPAMPGAVAKDVDMFLEWAAKQRQEAIRGTDQEALVSGAVAVDEENSSTGGDADKQGQDKGP